jgi:hypothetical protein
MIKLETKFSSTIVIQDVLLPNTWFIDIRLVANSSVNQKNYNIGLDRIEFYVSQILDNSILLSPKSGELFNQPIGLNGCVHMLPDEPYDHLIGIVLYTKLNSILEKVFFVVTKVIISHIHMNLAMVIWTHSELLLMIPILKNILTIGMKLMYHILS